MFLFQGWFTPLGLTCIYFKESMFLFEVSVGIVVSFISIIRISEVRNIRSLYIDGPHLIDKEKAFLTDNFIVYLNTFLEAHTPSTKKNLSSGFRQTAELIQMGVELHLLQEDRRKYRNNLFICYLHIADLRIIIQSLPLGYLVLVRLNWINTGQRI